MTPSFTIAAAGMPVTENAVDIDPSCTLVIAAEAPDAFTHLEAERLQLSPAPVESP